MLPNADGCRLGASGQRSVQQMLECFIERSQETTQRGRHMHRHDKQSVSVHHTLLWQHYQVRLTYVCYLPSHFRADMIRPAAM